MAEILNEHRKNGQRIVHCHGVFDLLHIGHIRYFGQAREMGDVLVVTITPDKDVDKGPQRPAFSEDLRAEAIASLDIVDFVAVNEWPTAEETIRLLRPDVYVKGSDFKSVAADKTGKLALEANVCKEVGAKLAFTTDIVFSSTNLINKFFSSFPDEVREYLEIFRKRYSLDYVIKILEDMANLRILVIGDTILDDYHYCQTLGTSSKDPALAVQYDSHDLFAGGVLAIANHCANFTDRIRLFSVIGDQDSYEDFIRSKLNPQINPFFMIQDGAPTLIKRRFVEGYSMTKLFEIYIMDDSGLSDEKDAELCNMLRKELPNYDLVIISDFGHGAISKNTVDTLINYSPFLAVNTQANAGNKRINTISRYSHADYVSIGEPELRLETRDLKGDLRPMTQAICAKLGCINLAVTLGKKGACVTHQDGSFVVVPAFAQKVVDRIGSGDAFFAVSAMAAYLETTPELIGFIGNVVGALAVEVVGNQKSIDKMSVVKYITSIMK